MENGLGETVGIGGDCGELRELFLSIRIEIIPLISLKGRLT